MNNEEKLFRALCRVRRLLDAFKKNKNKKKLMSSLCTEFPTVDIVA